MGVETAIIGGAVIGAWSADDQSRRAGREADRAMQSQDAAIASQERIADEQMAYQQELRSQWDEIYGPVEQNLSNYYNNLSPESYETLGIQANQESFQNAQKQLQQQLAQRGISGTGVEAQGLTNLAVQQAGSDARVRMQAPQAVAQQQQQFLGLGMGQRTQADQGIAGAFGQQLGVQGNMFNAATGSLNQALGRQQQADASFGNVIGSAAGAYANYQGRQDYLNRPQGT